MAISVNWATKVIFVPRADMTLLQMSPFEIRELDLEWFRLSLKSMEDGDEGMAFPDTHRHNAAVNVGGVVLAQVVEIINGYTVTFEDGQYAVNLVGANSNVGDKVNLNDVSVRSSNSAGLIQLETGVSGLTMEESDKLLSLPGLDTIEASTVLAKQDALLRALGLMQENYYLDQAVYNQDGRLTSGRIRTYTVPASVGTANNVLATYTVTAVWSGAQLVTYKVVKTA